jgi:hypothetical protein
MSHSITLDALDGSNPLAFLAALGTLRVLTLCNAPKAIRINWLERNGAWRPALSSSDVQLESKSITDQVTEYLSDPPQRELFEQIGPDLTISGRRLRYLAKDGAEKLMLAGPDQHIQLRAVCDFIAAFGCDCITADNDLDSQIEDTALRTMSGAGHQHFISFMREIIASTDSSHIHSSLFETWQYQDLGRGASLRWDPADDRRYALRWHDPSNDPNRTMRGANRLAIEALPLFTTAPNGRKLETTGFSQRRREGVLWTWPIWTYPINLQTTRGLLQMQYLQPPTKRKTKLELQSSSAREKDDFESGITEWKNRLQRLGISAIFQSKRITTGKFRNFTPPKMF